MPLAIRAMAAVHTHRLRQKLVAHHATGTATPRLLVFGIRSLFHVLHVLSCAPPQLLRDCNPEATNSADHCLWIFLKSIFSRHGSGPTPRIDLRPSAMPEINLQRFLFERIRVNA
jgi:hypothetical protein